MRHSELLLVVMLVLILLIAVFAALQLSRNSETPIYVGVEVAYANGTFDDVKNMVDKVKDYTNLLVIGSLDISLNQTTLNQTCDYIYNNGLHFIVLFTRNETYTTYNIFDWITDAKLKYADKFLGIYRYDEPGGNQIDQGNQTLVTSAADYNDAATFYKQYLGIIITYYRNYAPYVFTADYALHWFDYRSNYSAVFTEFASNNTREIAVAQDRGAANISGADWGTMITWKYDIAPYIEPPEELYHDMISAYNAGSKYIVIFNHPRTDMYGILSENHFKVMKQFWTYVHNNPQNFGSEKARVAYVLPENYGFGLRRAEDSIWGLFPTDSLSSKVWSDVNKLVTLYGYNFDIIYDEPNVVNTAKNRYEHLIYWNTTIT
ncbi:MAG TPA: hypothetical protein VK209_07495 [Candidatus Sulfotelmatobacter sp.]|nr:hypothetical protein [Candidatus Sulfotelmatobacter sp.]